jgi:hypothetical protein
MDSPVGSEQFNFINLMAAAQRAEAGSPPPQRGDFLAAGGVSKGLAKNPVMQANIRSQIADLETKRAAKLEEQKSLWFYQLTDKARVAQEISDLDARISGLRSKLPTE